MAELALVVPSQPVGWRGCWACRHYEIRPAAAAYCCHPRYRVPTAWLTAIARGQPCGGDNAPLWERRPAASPIAATAPAHSRRDAAPTGGAHG